ncbi:MAG TPA: hypothetical protein VFN74_18020, partial [Chloroflexota bacterium]|nr:hypothetical protein [Chloroflexota bacterium]
NQTGTATFNVTEDGKSAPGTYTQPSSSGRWNLWRQAATALLSGGSAAAVPQVPEAVRAAISAQGYYEETWDSEWGPTTFYYVGIIEPPGGQLAVTGVWQQPSGTGACLSEEGFCTGRIDGGVLDLASRALQFKYFQPWNETLGAATLQLAPDGLSFSGAYSHESGARGLWTLWRGEPCVAGGALG